MRSGSRRNFAFLIFHLAFFMSRTLFEKLWDSHVVCQQDDEPALLYIDLHLVHEVTSPQAF